MAGWESSKFKVHAVAAVPQTADASIAATAIITQIAQLVSSGQFNVNALINQLLSEQPGGDEITLYDFDVLQYSDAWELNAIPSANLSIAVGRRADAAGDRDKVAVIHDAVDQLRIQVPVVVYAKAERLDSGPMWFSEWPKDEAGNPKEFVLFRGYAIGGGFSREFGDARYVMALIHWLADLNFSSSISRSTQPMAPGALFYPASFNFVSGDFGGGILPAYVSPGLALQYFNAGTITKDFWGGENPLAHVTGDYTTNGGLKAWFTSLCAQDRINAPELNLALAIVGEPCFLKIPGANKEAQRALAKFEPFDNGNTPADVGPTGYRLGVPMAIDMHTSKGPFIASKIGEEIGKESEESYSSVTLWDKLAGQFHANYLYSIVPTVETALVVPFIPGLRGPAHRNIFAYEYGSLRNSVNLQRPLRGVAVMMGRTWATGAALSQEKGPSFMSIGGWHGVCRDGMIQFKNAPTWLTSDVPSRWTGESTPVSAAPIRTAVGGAGAPRADDSPRDIFLAAKPIWDAYAHALYAHEILKHRQAQLSGRVRFDLAPGSLVHIEATEDRFVNWLRDQRDSMWVWATVLRVSTVIDAESCKAGTSLHLAHVRTEEENKRDETSVPRHPLWLCQWSGCALIDDPAFAPVATHDDSCPTLSGDRPPNGGRNPDGTPINPTGVNQDPDDPDDPDDTDDTDDSDDIDDPDIPPSDFGKKGNPGKPGFLSQAPASRGVEGGDLGYSTIDFKGKGSIKE